MMKTNRSMFRSLLAALTMTLLLLGLAAPTASAQSDSQIVVDVPGLYPEGMDYDTKNDRYILGSFVSGNLVSVTPDGTTTPFGKAGSNVTGIEIDEARNRVLAAVTALPSGQAKLAIHDLDTGAQQAIVDLGGLLDDGRLFANDIAVGPDGTAYVTNTGAGAIYAVSLDGDASVFAEDPRFEAVTEGQSTQGLNGIVSTGDDLLVGFTPTGAMFRVSIADPTNVSEVALTNPLPGLDGMVLSSNGRQMAVVSGAASLSMLLTSTDGWASATPAGVFETGPTFPTAVAAVDGGFDVLYAHLDKLSVQGAQPFEITRAAYGAPSAGGELALTGAGQTSAITIIGVALLAAGAGALRLSRREDSI